MADNEQDLTLRLQFVADTKAADEASKKIEDLGKKSDDAGDKQKKASESAKDFGKSSGRAAEMVGSLTGALGQASPAAAQLGAGLRVIKALAEGAVGGIAGLVTILIASAIGAWTSFQRKVAESEKAIADFNMAMVKTHNEAASNKLAKATADHEKLRSAIIDESSAVERLNQAYATVDNAQKASELADINLREREQLAGVKEGPRAEVERARITSEASAKRRDVETKYDAIEIDNKVRSSNAKLQTAELQMDSNKREVDENTAAVRKLSEKLEALNNARMSISGGAAPTKKDYSVSGLWKMGWDFDPGDVVDKDQQKVMLDNIAEQTKGVRDELAERKKIIDEGNSRISALDKELFALRAERAASEIEQQTFRSTRPKLDALDDADSANAVARAEWAQRLTDLRNRSSSAASSLSTRAVQFRAASDAYNPQRSDYDDQGDWNKARSKDRTMESQAKGAEKLADSAQKLNDQLAKMKPEQLASVFDSITRQLSFLDSAIKNLPNN